MSTTVKDRKRKEQRGGISFFKVFLRVAVGKEKLFLGSRLAMPL